jgi:hypothetical protein
VLALAVEVAGWGGAALLLLAYGLLATKRLSDGASYHAMNLVGAAGLGLNGAYHGALPSVALNVVWVALGVVALLGARRLRRASSSHVGSVPP